MLRPRVSFEAGIRHPRGREPRNWLGPLGPPPARGV